MNLSTLYAYLNANKNGKNLFHQIIILSILYSVAATINAVIIGAIIKVVGSTFLTIGIHSIVYVIISLIIFVTYIVKKKVLNLAVPLIVLLIISSVISIPVALKYRNIAEDLMANNMDNILNTYGFYQNYVSDYIFEYKNELGEKVTVTWECLGKKYRIDSLVMKFASNSSKLYSIASKIYPDVNVKQYKDEMDNIILAGDYSYKDITKYAKKEDYTNVKENRFLHLVIDEDNYMFDTGYGISLRISGNIEQ